MSFLKTESDRTKYQNIRYSGVNCELGVSKSIRYSDYFVIGGFVIAGFVSTCFTVILPGFQMLSCSLFTG